MTNKFYTRNQFLRKVAAAAGIALSLAFTGTASSQVLLLSDSFGGYTDGARSFVGGKPVPVDPVTKRPLDLDQVLVEFALSNPASTFWSTAPGGKGGLPGWAFTTSSPDPTETLNSPADPVPGATDGSQGSLSLQGGTGQDALLPFTAPSSAFTLSLDVIPGSGSVVIGFSPVPAANASAAQNNFASPGSVWLRLDGSTAPATWTLHTGTGPDLTGTATLNNFNPLTLTLDPVTHLASGTVNASSTGPIGYDANSVFQSVGFEGTGSGVIVVDDFTVKNGTSNPCLNFIATISSRVDVAVIGQATGSATVSVTGGTPGYTYSWNTTPVQTTAAASGLSPGTYTVTVIDANNCQTSTSVTIKEPTVTAALVANISSQSDASCFGGANGTATVSATGGTPTYAYHWNTTPVQTTAVASGLSAGTYIVTVSDASNSQATANVTIGQPTQLLAGSAAGSIACKGGTTTVTVSATGGMAPYTGTGSKIVSAGPYSFSVTDANGCIATTSGTVSEPATALSATSTAGSITCAGGTTTVLVDATGGTAPYTGTGAKTVSAGPYSFTVGDANGCTAIASGTIGQPAAIAFASSATAVTCSSCIDGSVTVIGVTGGSGSYVYSIDNGATFQVSNVFGGLGAGSYALVVKDSNACLSAPQNATVPPPAIPTSQANTAPVLVSIPNQTVTVGKTLTLTATATDADVPAQALTFRLGQGAPFGATITKGGLFTWTPKSFQALVSYSITVIVTDSGSPTMSNSTTFSVAVKQANVAPVLAPIPDQAGTAGTLISFTATATDADLPPQKLNFRLGQGAPSGASITGGGLFTWTPTPSQAPATYQIPIVVTDNGTPAMSAKGTVTVKVSQPDTTLPSFNCPQNKVVRTADPCVAVNYSTPTVTDSVPVITISCSPPSGTCFVLGTTVVTCVATDAANNTASCSFAITVRRKNQ